MAAPLWIKTASNLPRHPKLITAAEMLSITRAEMLGRLVMLWIYALEFRPAGIFENREEIARAMEWPPADAARLVAALQLCGGFGAGFIERPRPSDGEHVVLHDWTDFSGSIENMIIKRRNRREEKEKEKTAAPSGSVTQSDAGAPRDKNFEAWLKKLQIR